MLITRYNSLKWSNILSTACRFFFCLVFLGGGQGNRVSIGIKRLFLISWGGYSGKYLLVPEVGRKSMFLQMV